MEIVDNTFSHATERPGSNVVYFNKNPHIHVHSLVDDYSVLKEKNDGVLEICCHCCGESLYVLFNIQTLIDNPNGHPAMGTIKEEFIEIHEACSAIEIPFGVDSLRADDFRLVCCGKRSKTTTVSIKG